MMHSHYECAHPIIQLERMILSIALILLKREADCSKTQLCLQIMSDPRARLRFLTQLNLLYAKKGETISIPCSCYEDMSISYPASTLINWPEGKLLHLFAFMNLMAGLCQSEIKQIYYLAILVKSSGSSVLSHFVKPFLNLNLKVKLFIEGE